MPSTGSHLVILLVASIGLGCGATRNEDPSSTNSAPSSDQEQAQHSDEVAPQVADAPSPPTQQEVRSAFSVRAPDGVLKHGAADFVFRWPTPSSATVRWEVTKGDQTAEAQVRIELSRVDGSETPGHESLRLAVTDFEFTKFNNAVVTRSQQKELSRLLGPSFSNSFTIGVAHDGTSLGLYDIETLIRDTAALTDVAPAEVRALLADPGIRVAIENRATEWWQLWVENWMDFQQRSPGNESYEAVRRHGKLTPWRHEKLTPS